MKEAQSWKRYQAQKFMNAKINSGWNWLMEKANIPQFKHVELEMDSIAGKSIMDIEETNEYIADGIIKQKPFFVGRFGSVELNMIVQVLDVRYGGGED